MIIRSIIGKSSADKPGGVNRFGPAKLSGEALGVRCGSVRMFIPPYCISKVEWPIQGSVRSSLFSFKNCGSLSASWKWIGSGLVLFQLHLITSENGLLIALVYLFWKLPPDRWCFFFVSVSGISFALEEKKLLRMKSIITNKII